MREGITFDDVLLVPKVSHLSSRDEVDISTNIAGIPLSTPIISSPMDSVTEGPMARFMGQIGGLGIIHRYNSVEDQVEEVKWAKQATEYVGAAVAVNGDSWERANALAEAGVDLFVLDIAHGHTKQALKRIEELSSDFSIPVVSGNIATAAAARSCIAAGASALRVGIGAGSACSTRVIAGVGVPQLTALKDIVDVIKSRSDGVSIISDGGIRTSGDIVKALAAGADAVMLGGMLSAFPVSAGKFIYEELGDSDLPEIFDTRKSEEGSRAIDIFTAGVTPLEMKKYVKKKVFRGMASDSALSDRNSGESYIVEGESFTVEVDYDFEQTMQTIIGGVRAGFAYLGASFLKDLQDKAEFVKISTASVNENYPHYGR